LGVRWYESQVLRTLALSSLQNRYQGALGRKTYEPGGGGERSRGSGVRVRVARSRAVVAAGYQPVVVARIAGVSRLAR
jgi:hypothetical protein